MRTTLNGRLGEAMVVMAGYDDASITNAVDQVMAEAEAQGVKQVLWLTYRTNTAYVLPGGIAARDLYGSHNSRVGGSGATTQLVEDPRLGQVHGGPIELVRRRRRPSQHRRRQRTGHVHPRRARRHCRRSADAAIANALDRRRRQRNGTAAVPPTDPAGFVPLPPKRVLDTRDPLLGGASGMLGAGHVVAIDVSEIVPSDAVAAVFSVTATGSCVPGFLTVFACGARPPTSNINYEVGRTTAGLAITPMTDGKACIFASNPTDVIVDVMGAFTPDGDRFHPMTPTRWIDTRGGASQLPTSPGREAPSADASADAWEGRRPRKMPRPCG